MKSYVSPVTELSDHELRVIGHVFSGFCNTAQGKDQMGQAHFWKELSVLVALEQERRRLVLEALEEMTWYADVVVEWTPRPDLTFGPRDGREAD
jgi:hypothetical protein